MRPPAPAASPAAAPQSSAPATAGAEMDSASMSGLVLLQMQSNEAQHSFSRCHDFQMI